MCHPSLLSQLLELEFNYSEDLELSLLFKRFQKVTVEARKPRVFKTSPYFLDVSA